MYPLFCLNELKRSVMKKFLVCIVLLLLYNVALADQSRVEVPIGDSPVFGPDDAPVTIIEFIDFQ